MKSVAQRLRLESALSSGVGERRLFPGASGECSLAGDLERFLEGDPDPARPLCECTIMAS